MRRIVNSKITISAVPVLCVLGWYTYYRFFSSPSSSLPNLFDVYGTPIVISLTATLLFCVFFSEKSLFREFVRLSLPVTFIYLIVYAILPSIQALIHDYSFESLGFTLIIFFSYDIPLVMLLLFANSFMGWLGSFLHTKLFKTQTRQQSPDPARH